MKRARSAPENLCMLKHEKRSSRSDVPNICAIAPHGDRHEDGTHGVIEHLPDDDDPLANAQDDESYVPATFRRFPHRNLFPLSKALKTAVSSVITERVNCIVPVEGQFTLDTILDNIVCGEESCSVEDVFDYAIGLVVKAALSTIARYAAAHMIAFLAEDASTLHTMVHDIISSG